MSKAKNEFGVSTWSFDACNYKDAFELIDAAAAHGIHALDLTLDGYKAKFYDWYTASTPDAMRHFEKVAAYAKGKGVRFFQTHAPFTSFPHWLEDDFFALTEKAVAVTNAVGARYCVMHPLVFPIIAKKDWEKQEKAFNLRFFSRLQPVLKRYDVTACLENIYDWYEGNICNVFVSDPKNLCEYIDEAGENFAACLDTGHYRLFTDAPVRNAVEIFGKRLKTLHVHDNDGVKDLHLIPYMGVIDWDGFTDALHKVGYEGTINCELKPLKYIGKNLGFLTLAEQLLK